jgi:protein N-terminal amidase
MKIRVAAVQLNSILGNVEENASKALRLLEQTFSGTNSNLKPDLIVLPELALTGYNFKSSQHISPYLEYVGKGPSYEFAKKLSSKWNCHTLLGYPEKCDTPTLSQIFNSAMLVSPTGDIVHNYRKTHLFETDKTWGCSESPDGFQAFNLEFNGEEVRTTIGICMDLNPYEFKAPFDKYEFASFATREKCQLILVPTAWMDSNWDEHWTTEQVKAFHEVYERRGPIIEHNKEHNVYADQRILYNTPETKRAEDYDLEDVDGSTGRYWVIRMNSLYSIEHEGRNQCVVVCNRSGMEDRLMYAGTSTMYTFHGGPMRQGEDGISIDFTVEGSLGQGTEGVLVRELEV